MTAYEEKGANVNGAYYLFEATPAGSDQWREIMTFRHDDDPKISADQVRYVNDNIGYVFMGWMYAVTTDAGRTGQFGPPNETCRIGNAATTN